MLSARRLSRAALLLSALLLLFTLPASAEEKMLPPPPAFPPGGKVVTLALAKQLHDRNEAKFYDTRSIVEFEQARIAGATLLTYVENSDPVKNFDRSVDIFNTVQLPPNKGRTLVFYCDGPHGWRSYKAAVLAIKEGYRDVLWLREGLNGWQSAQYPVE